MNLSGSKLAGLLAGLAGILWLAGCTQGGDDAAQRSAPAADTAVHQAETAAGAVDEVMARGMAVYASNCQACHQADGQGLAPAFPALAGSEVTQGPLEENIEIVLHGREGTAMQAWGTMLSDSDIAAALTYTRNAFGNETGDVVQPQTIARIKNG